MSRKDTHILVVDDDSRLRTLLEEYLVREGYEVTTAESGAAALALLEKEMFDAAVIDVMMPHESGVELTKFLRETPPWPYHLPVLMLTSQNEPEDRITGLESGADDYLGKPFEPRELVLRIESLLKRGQGAPSAVQKLAGAVVTFGEYTLTLETGDLRRGGSFINLSSGELNLLSILARSMDIPITREEIAQQLNGISERSVDVQVTRLRKRIEDNPRRPRYIKAMWGKGYVLRSGE